MLTLSLLLALLQLCRGMEDYGESRGDQSHHGSEVFDDFETYDYGDSTTSLDKYREALNTLFGSEEYLSDVLYKDLNMANYLDLATAKFYISQAIEKPENYSRLNSSQKEEISQVIAILDEVMSKADDGDKHKWMVDALMTQAKKMVDILSLNSIVNHLQDLSNPESALTNCQSGYLVSWWREIVDTSSHSGNVPDSTLDFAIKGLVQTGQSIRNVTIYKGNIAKAEIKSSEDRFKLLSMLSRRKNIEFAARALGGMQPLEDLVQSILCEKLELSLVKNMLEKLVSVAKEKDFASRLITNPEEMTILIEMQTTLGVVTKDVAETETLLAESGVNSRRIPGHPTLPNIGQQILDSYMDLVDTAVNKETVEIWAQMTTDEANEKLHQLLLSNEQYVGSVSDVILGSGSLQENYQLEKESLSVRISKVHLEENNNTSSEFAYEDTYIKTDNIAQLDATEGDDLRVYALRYKSWSDMIRNILMKHFDLENNNDASQTRNHTREKRAVDEYVDTVMANKSFVGKGGIVSLSVKQNGVKRSLPATYWIGFNNVTYNGNKTCLRLSCEYLDPETITWESRGCHLDKVERYGITCKCNHTTNFAAFMMPAEPLVRPTVEEEKALKILSMVGSFLSICGLVGTLTIFYLVRHLVRNDRLKAHAHLSFSLLVVNITYLLGDLWINNNTMCAFSTIVSHYFLLAVFMWMLIEGIFLYLYVVQVFLRSKVVSYNWMYFVGWGIPLLIVIVTAGYGIPNDVYIMPAINSIEDNKTLTFACPEGSYQYPPPELDPVVEEEPKYERCWLNTEGGVIWAFLTPAVLVLAFNTAIMCKTLKICIKSLRNQRKMSSRSESLLHSKHHSSSGYSRDSSSRTHSGSFSDLHGKPEVTSRHAPVPSPCLLQVTTEEEKKEESKRHESSSISSIENTTFSQDNVKSQKQKEDGSKAKSSRYHSANGDTSRIRSSQSSIMYRNSVSKNSPRFSAKSKSHGSNMAKLTSERVAFFRDAKAAVKGAIILLPILGIPWILGFFAHLSVAMMFLFIILNSTQGIAIFVVYGLCNGEARRAMKRRSAVRSMKLSVDGGFRRTSSTSTARSFLRFGRRRSTVVTTT